jgi:hypothetical protein
MDMEIGRLASTSWLQIPDWQAFVMHTVRMSSQAQPASSQGQLPPHVPMLDWSATLFEDERFCR